ncbi:Interferon-induced, double-stranded RNA-activated protein kinase, partial [Apaloderma vittatum]
MARECMEKINHYCQKNKLTLVYANVSMTGPSHDPEFTIVIKINDVEYGTGTGKNKKEAKAVAAKNTWEMIEKQLESPSTPVTLLPDIDYVSLLNTFSQRTLQKVDYHIRECTGMFSCSCLISGFLYGNGTGTSSAAAKQDAAKEAFEKIKREKSNSNTAFTQHRNFSPVPSHQLFFSTSGICLGDSAAKLEEKMRDMAVCEKPSPSQQGIQNSALKSKRKLAAIFDNARDKEEKKMSDKNLPNLDTNTSEENESPCTVNTRFLQSFKNIKPIGEGGYGNVFRATGKLDERTYAVKRVRFTKNVEREVKGLASLDHENIVRYYCSWEGYDRVTYPDSREKSDKEIRCLFIQMELCEQGPLENWVERNRRDRKYHEMAQTTFLQILEGVKYIHSEGFIHRDLKPQNIFLSRDDKIKIGDFGLVTSVDYETQTQNRGTKSYMAPEQAGDSYGNKVDIYALGLVWFEILSAVSCHEKMKLWPDVREGKLPESFSSQFPGEAPIIKKMLSRDASGRYSASEILQFFKSVRKD